MINLALRGSSSGGKLNRKDEALSTLIVLMLGSTLFGVALFRTRPLVGAVICGAAAIIALWLPLPLVLLPLAACFSGVAVFLRRQNQKEG